MELLDRAYDREVYLTFLAEKFNFSRNLAPIEIEIDNNEVKIFQKLGFATTSDDKKLPVFEIQIKPNTQLSRNRVQLRNLVAKQIKTEDGALAVYVDKKNNQWRFSFISIKYNWTDEGVTEEQTSSKRFTYLLGKNTKTRTARKRFEKINQQSTLENIKDAFSVETLSKEFYDKLYKWYKKAQTQVFFPNDEKTENHKETSLIRLLTRLLFIWFLKEKKLINADLFDKVKLQTLIDYEKPSSFYKAILQNLFFATLNRTVKKRSFRTTTNGVANKTNYLATNIYRYQDYFKNNDKQAIIALFKQTPFLNGGLFECLDREASDTEKQDYLSDKTIRPVESAIRIDGFSDKANNKLDFKNTLFFNDDEQDLGLIDLFNQYQFTVEESTPLDVEIALDPELLGKVFENLLASYNPETGQQARKATGSFYTPREIVGYMVDESLKQHFKQHTDLDENKIQDLFVDEVKQENTTNKLTEEQKETVVKAIDNLKILDPAVGSGAYPMGILQRLVFILEKIDPQNILFKRQQLDKAEQIPDEISRDSSKDAIEKVFSQENQHNAYGKKLCLIEQCIYGVDIQPIAIQICKLRFFISLTIEQTPNKDETDNYGIKALPNLETKFIVANSLLPLGEMPKQMGLWDEKITELQKKIAEVRHKYFSAKTLDTKRKYRDHDKSLREEMLEELTKNGITPSVEASMKKIVHWDLYNQNAVADWFDPQWQFGVKDGFDIVIGNPPYNEIEKNKFYATEYKDVLKGHYDLYIFFYKKFYELARINSGIIVIITPHSYLSYTQFEKLRTFIYEHCLIINCTSKIENVFDSAVVDNSIMIMKKTNDKKSSLFTKAILKNDKLEIIDSMRLNKNEYNQSTFEFEIIKNKVHLKKFYENSEVLGEIVESSQGITVYAKVQGEKINWFRTELTDNDTKKVTRGKEIEAYKLNWNNNYIQYGKWLWCKRNSKFFVSPKIFLRQTSDKIIATYIEEEFYCIDSVHSIISKNKKYNIKYILSVINSNITNYIYQKLTMESGKVFAQVKLIKLREIPIPKISKPEQQPFIELVDKILTAKKEGGDTRGLEAEIDRMVYKLYNLSDDEIDIVEGGK